MKLTIKDPVSALTHFIGAIVALAGVVALVVKSNYTATIWHTLSFSLFGISLVLLYTASTVYHIIDKPKALSVLLRRIDHMMIFVLIAGTYTPICLVPLRNGFGYTLLTIIWCIAVIGVLTKIFWINAPSWLAAATYILMGWTAVIALGQIKEALPSGGFTWLLIGGVIYTLGGIIYGLKWPNFKFKNFGFHELFHLFVIGGSICHFILMYNYIMVSNL
ncbi:hemolysin III family protein [Vallitalea pronyensis]|uniref:Hemolysin III family protein n=1 Tax=Vallitalea pronyensis TaxID=1348613 RepID=A0A8J8SHC0_9FIRM|nr:hemolysin III family protein [Vallitalea pronyensis]QUI23279.1 hemolysin III family protein [Vallitalea pronyensis]